MAAVGAHLCATHHRVAFMALVSVQTSASANLDMVAFNATTVLNMRPTRLFFKVYTTQTALQA